MLMDGFTALNTLCRAFAEVRREEQLEISLKEVQRTANEVLVFTKKNQRANALGLVASVVQLVFFELFAGESCAWKVHLDAAIDMYAKGRRDGLANYNLNQKSKKLLYEDSVLGDFTVEDDGPTIVHEVVTFRFVGATVIWLDLISSITAGTSPRLLQYHPGAFREESQVKFEDVVGCPNAVALEMGRIAYMHDQITQEQEQGLLAGSNNKYRDEAARIYRSLETFMQTIRTTSMIPFTSRIFAYASLVYLHLVTDGFKETDRLGYVVCAAIQDIQKEGYGQAITAVICPLFIIGCIARQGEEQQLFRGLLSSRPITGHLPKHRDRILPILEEIWSRKGLPSFVWNDVIRMTTGVLLV
ncbi:fungal-specific transcription factor domain-containing protein [Aspergillus karnatakaensis]|uniref:transcription factor domain-containing protein n=1 Tax=Aspergillus karnatakaensis TaxID=1810916 RepID=UPI003CCDB4F8